MTRWALAAALCVGGCSALHSDSDAPATRAELTPAQIYSVGESRFTEGHYDEAVLLWHHAAIRLPPNADNDRLRHKLVLRTAYGQLMVWSTTGDPLRLSDALEMLDAYLAFHENLFGDSDRAQTERGEVYAIRYEIERRLPVAQAQARAERASEALAVDEDSDDALDSESVGDEGPASGSAVRQIVVKRDRPSIEDPETRATLASAFSDGQIGYVLAAPQTVPLHGARMLVRGGAARPIAESMTPHQRRGARRVGDDVVEQSRPALKACYEAAFARHPVPDAHGVVEFTINEAGAVTDAVIVDGGLVDTLGDLCLLDGLKGINVVEPQTTGRIRLPLLFMVHGEVVIYEYNARSRPADSIPLYEDIMPAPDPAADPG